MIYCLTKYSFTLFALTEGLADGCKYTIQSTMLLKINLGLEG